MHPFRLEIKLTLRSAHLYAFCFCSPYRCIQPLLRTLGTTRNHPSRSPSRRIGILSTNPLQRSRESSSIVTLFGEPVSFIDGSNRPMVPRMRMWTWQMKRLRARTHFSFSSPQTLGIQGSLRGQRCPWCHHGASRH